MKDTINQAEEYRRNADELRKYASSVRTKEEKEAFEQLAEGYNVLAEQLDHLWRPEHEDDVMTWLLGRGGGDRNARLHRRE